MFGLEKDHTQVLVVESTNPQNSTERTKTNLFVHVKM